MFSQGGTSSSDQQGQSNKRQRTAAMYHRKRAVTACQSCRLRKTKCDNRLLKASSDPTTHVPENDILQVLDRLDFPSTSNNCESIMRWPIFQDLVPEVHSFVLELNEDVEAGPSDARGVSGGKGVQEEDFIQLSKRFLAYVHVKNPILDVKDYKKKVREVAENGPRWDGASCLVVSIHSIRFNGPY
uniref:Zn(2)-C6 fungal-type domain-containing protein n=1 Tax=Fusarium oxysporum (strain Fo5176) TaxID=660025 RepID=A0A0D2XPI6_FUSOF